jgi:hypothetical protein
MVLVAAALPDPYLQSTLKLPPCALEWDIGRVDVYPTAGGLNVGNIDAGETKPLRPRATYRSTVEQMGYRIAAVEYVVKALIPDLERVYKVGRLFMPASERGVVDKQDVRNKWGYELHVHEY